jgi:hypothetical protein
VDRQCPATAVTTTEEWLLVALLMLQPFAVELAGKPLSLTMLAAAVWMVWRLIQKKAEVRAGILAAYAGMVLVVAGVTLYNVTTDAANSSLLAFVFFIAMYALVAFVSASSFKGAERILSRFSAVVALLGVVGFAQVIVQLAGFGFWDYSALPDSLVLPGYNNQIFVDVFGGIFKANGVVFLEPSFLSKYSALALVIEATGRRRLIVATGLASGLVLSFSGSGVILLVVAAPFLLAKLPIRMIAATLACVVAMIIVAPSVSDQFTSRTGEFSDSRSSAYIRFLAPYLAVVDGTSDFNLVVGNGIGSLEESTIGGISFFKTADSLDGKAYDVTAVKLLVELGILGFIAYATFFLMAFNPKRLGWITFVSITSIVWITTGALLQAQTMLLVALIGALVANSRKGFAPARATAKKS